MATNKSKKNPVRKANAPKPAKPAPAPARPKDEPSASKRSVTMEKPSKKSAKSALRDSILARKSASKPIAFSLDEVRAIAKTNAAKVSETAKKAEKTGPKPAKTLLAVEKPAKPNHVKAASLAEILGFNPRKPKAAEAVVEKEVPEKFRRYHRLLVDMRDQLTEGIERHSEESLKRSAKDDAGDLSAYGQNVADGGINTFDRDFVLSLVSSEQEALTEIDAAIKRIHDGSYGTCEISGKPIAKERLLAVPFTRYTAEAQKELEKNRYRARPQSGIFSESEEGGKVMEDDSGGDD